MFNKPEDETEEQPSNQLLDILATRLDRYSDIDERQLFANKIEMINIMKNSPKVGVYQGEDKDDWAHFFSFYIDFLKSEIGPRGQCTKKVRQKLLQQEEFYNQVLAPFGQDATTGIQFIFTKHQSFIPCEEYIQCQKAQDTLNKAKESLRRLNDPSSVMHCKIVEGFVEKHGPDYDVAKQIEEIKAKYREKIEMLETQVSSLSSTMQKSQRYQEYMKVKEVMSPFFKKWQSVNSGVGIQNGINGQKFEGKVLNQLLPYLLKRQQVNQNSPLAFHDPIVYINAQWIPRELGEIDIALGYKEKGKYYACTLIQCKSRLFDVRAAFGQVSLKEQIQEGRPLTLAELREQKKIKKAEAELRAKQKRQAKIAKKQLINQKLRSQTGFISDNSNTKVNNTLEDQLSKPFKVETFESQKTSKEPNQQLEQVKAPTVIKKAFLSTKYGEAEVIPNHKFYIVTTLPRQDFILPIESLIKQSIEKFTRNKCISEIASEELFEYLRARFADMTSPLEWFLTYESQFTGEQSNIIVLKERNDT